MFTLSGSDGFFFGATTVEDGNFLNEGTDAYAARCLAMIRREHPDVSCAIVARTIHGSRVEIVTPESPAVIRDTDGLATSDSGIALCLTGADCAPVFLADSVMQSIALIHSGRRGTHANIASNAVLALKESFGSRVADLRATIGPGICAEHYAVSSEIAEPFRAMHPSRVRDSLLDLPGIIRDQLVASGVPSDQIATSPDCTFEHPEKWFSHRRDVRDGIAEFRVQVFFAVRKNQ